MVALLAVAALLLVPAAPRAQSFGSSLVPTGLTNPTSLRFGPDGRLYVSEQAGTVRAYAIVRNAPNAYAISASETITLVKLGVPNHDDDASACSAQCDQRQVTGLTVAGTAAQPVLYVSSSDSRHSVGADSGLDTNSGVVSRLTCSGGISAGVCQGWEHVDIVRGLPRSEENHAVNGLIVDPANNRLLLTIGGNSNRGAPGSSFSGTPEYFLAGAILSIDLAQIAALEAANGGPFIDPRNGSRFVYDLVTLDDPTRPNIDHSDPQFPYPPGHPRRALTIDLGDPFGGNNGLNQAVPEPGGPVQVFSPGYRNAYDVLLTASGDLYTWDNGSNAGWGGTPFLYTAAGVRKGYSTQAGVSFDAAAGDYCSNEFNESGSASIGDTLKKIGAGYYGGHPAPIRAFPGLSGIRVYAVDGSGAWVQDGPTRNFADLLPAGYGLSLADFPNDPRQCDYTVASGALETISASTNGLAEYTASHFGGAMQGDLLTVAFNGNLYRCKPDGAGGLVDLPGNAAGTSEGRCEVLFGGYNSIPLDLTTQGDADPFPGTIWMASYLGGSVTVFEPQDIGPCDLSNPAADADGDGYSNGDEQASGSDPCSPGSTPSDHDGDFVSDRSDSDDDNDGVADVTDVFALDASNGLSTVLPLHLPLFNNVPGNGLFGLGFTGLMLPLDGSTTWRELFDSEQLAAGGAAGLLTVEAVTAGDALGSSNTQDYGFLFGAAVDSSTAPFTLEARLRAPWFALDGDSGTPAANASYGVFIGTGSQDEYLKLVLASDGAGGTGVRALLESGGNVQSRAWSSSAWNGGNLLAANEIDLYLEIDPAQPSAQPLLSLDGGNTRHALGGPIPLPAAWFSAADARGLAIGTLSTTGGAAAYAATWDYFTLAYGSCNASGTPLYRINVGGPAVAAADGSLPDWAVDTAAQPSAHRIGGGAQIASGSDGGSYAGPVVMTHPSVPASAPAALYQHERWDPSSAPEMQWSFPVASGEPLLVRLHFAELYAGITAAGQRVFDVSVEGSVPPAFDNIDPYANAGPKGAFMREAAVTVSDGSLDLSFLHGIENPALKAIEIVSLAEPNTPPTLQNPGPQSSVAGSGASLAMQASDADGDPLSYSASGLPPGLTINPSSGLISGTIAANAANASPYAVSVGVSDGTDSVSASFSWTVQAPPPNQPPTARDDGAEVAAGGSVTIALLANDSDPDGSLVAGSIEIVSAPAQGSVTAAGSGQWSYSHGGAQTVADQFRYRVADDDGAWSNIVTVRIKAIGNGLPADVDNDGQPNAADPDDDNDGWLDTEDPFALDAANGRTTALPLRHGFPAAAGRGGLFGLGFSGLMATGQPGAPGADYLSLLDSQRLFAGTDPAQPNTLTLAAVDVGDARHSIQRNGLQLGVDLDRTRPAFVVSARMRAPWFGGAPQSAQSQGLYLGRGDQQNYLKLAFDAASNGFELLLEQGGVASSELVSLGNPLAATELRLLWLVDPASAKARAFVSIDGAKPVALGALVNLPAAWFDADDNRGLAVGLIATSRLGQPYNAHWSELAVEWLASDDSFSASEDATAAILTVQANDALPGLVTISAIGAGDRGGSAVLDNLANANPADDRLRYTPAAHFAGIETLSYTVDSGAGISGSAVVAVSVAAVNDPPSITLAGNIAVANDAGPQVIPGFASNFQAGGGADEAGQQIAQFLLTNSAPALFAQPPQIDTSGTLRFTPAAGAQGSATIGVRVRDSGGSANGGNDLSAPQNVVISIGAAANQADLSLSLAEDRDPVSAGSTLVYTATVRNAGPATATNIALDLSLPALTANPTTAGCSEDPAGVPTCHLASLAPGAQASVLISVDVDPAAAGQQLVASASVSATQNDPATGNNSASASTAVQAPPPTSADLAIELEASGSFTASGGTRRYLITVRNFGPHAVTAARVIDMLPPRLTDASWTCSADPGSACAAAGSGSIDQPVNLAVNGRVMFTLDATIADGDPAPIVNTVLVNPPAGISDPDPGNNEATDTASRRVYKDGFELPASS